MKLNLSEKLSELKQALNPQAAFMKTLQSMIPKIIPQVKEAASIHFNEIQKPISEGGELKEGESMIGYWVGFTEDKIIISRCAIKFDENAATMSEPHFTLDAEQFLNGFLNTQKQPENE